jgi:RNA polymerase sigma factor (sigma-70 family)
MLIGEITLNYFVEGTRGYNILRNYYTKYKDLFQNTIHNDFNDFLNQILLNISAIKFSDEIKNIESYIIGSIKIQCRVQLDKALKQKNRLKIVDLKQDEEEDAPPPIQNYPAENSSPDKIVETEEIFKMMNNFKYTINPAEVELLNALIDEMPRQEIAEKRNINLNTLDTQIRRLRIKFVNFLSEKGYNFKIFGKFRK